MYFADGRRRFDRVIWCAPGQLRPSEHHRVSSRRQTHRTRGPLSTPSASSTPALPPPHGRPFVHPVDVESFRDADDRVSRRFHLPTTVLPIGPPRSVNRSISNTDRPDAENKLGRFNAYACTDNSGIAFRTEVEFVRSQWRPAGRG